MNVDTKYLIEQKILIKLNIQHIINENFPILDQLLLIAMPPFITNWKRVVIILHDYIEILTIISLHFLSSPH